MPAYDIDDVVYLRASAQAGFLEAVRIATVLSGQSGQWVYTVLGDGKLPSPPSFGDRIQYPPGPTLYYNESELVVYCDALEIVEDYLESRLVDIRSKRSAHC